MKARRQGGGGFQKRLGRDRNLGSGRAGEMGKPLEGGGGSPVSGSKDKRAWGPGHRGCSRKWKCGPRLQVRRIQKSAGWEDSRRWVEISESRKVIDVRTGDQKKEESLEARRGSSHCGSVVTNLTSILKDMGLIPGLAQWVKDPALP